ncbi:MAG: hypothetical protein V4649_12915 [Bacteroidota bacterium]
MNSKITAREGWIEVEIDGNCEYSKFEEAATLLRKKFKVRFIEKLHDLDSAYWDFVYKDCELTLHFNLGISLFPKKFGESTATENECAKKIGSLLFEAINQSS